MRSLRPETVGDGLHTSKLACGHFFGTLSYKCDGVFLGEFPLELWYGFTAVEMQDAKARPT
jgi:hypothetical protein